MSGALDPRTTVDLPELSARTGALLRAHVPLTLLLDLGGCSAPRSSDLYAEEPADDAWLAGLPAFGEAAVRPGAAARADSPLL